MTLFLNGTWKVTHRPYQADIQDILAENFVPEGWLNANVPEEIHATLRRAGATFEGDAPQAARTGEEITRADLLDRGLIGPGSAEKRAALLKTLRLPEHLSTAALVQTLNLLMSREEFERL